MNPDVLHLLNQARQLHDLKHKGQGEFDECYAWVCRRSRAAAERLDSRIYTAPTPAQATKPDDTLLRYGIR